MFDTRIIFLGLWVVKMLTILWGDELGLICGDTKPKNDIVLITNTPQLGGDYLFG